MHVLRLKRLVSDSSVQDLLLQRDREGWSAALSVISLFTRTKWIASTKSTVGGSVIGAKLWAFVVFLNHT